MTNKIAYGKMNLVTNRATKGGGEMAKNRKLRSLIYLNFDSETDCAKALGWERQRLNRITNNQKCPTIDEVNQLSAVLHSNVETVMGFFLQ